MTEATDAVIVAATRTPIGRSGRSLAGLTIHDIGMQTVSAVIAAAGLDVRDVDDAVGGLVWELLGHAAEVLVHQHRCGSPPGRTERGSSRVDAGVRFVAA